MEKTPQTFDIANEDPSRFDSTVGLLESAGEPFYIKDYKLKSCLSNLSQTSFGGRGIVGLNGEFELK